MAKPNYNNNNKNNQKKQFNDYFSTGIKQKGTGFLSFKNPQDLQRDAVRIFRDIARGNIDIEKYEEYFLNPMLLDNMVICANSKLLVETILRDGVSLLYSQQVTMEQNIPLQPGCTPPSSTTTIVLQNQMSKVDAYIIIVNCLTSFQQTGDIAWIFTLAAQLNPYKYTI